MRRYMPIAFVALTVAACLAPQAARAWSERPAPTNSDGSSMFTDPDQNIERLTGRSETGEQRQGGGFTTQQGNGSWSFSVTPQSSSSASPFGSMFGLPLLDRRR